jgi:8-oxo-dGTP diphosphatase
MAQERDAIRAGGGVVYRRSEEGHGETLLVYRVRYGEWSFPKGKARQGEPDDQCALREVEEETGVRCALEAELSGTSYRDHKGRPKSVRYWAMRPLSGVAGPRNEIDAVCWTRLATAGSLLTHAHDRALLAQIADHLGIPER